MKSNKTSTYIFLKDIGHKNEELILKWDQVDFLL